MGDNAELAVKFDDDLQWNQGADVLFDPGVIAEDAAIGSEQTCEVHRRLEPLDAAAEGNHRQQAAANDRGVVAIDPTTEPGPERTVSLKSAVGRIDRGATPMPLGFQTLKTPGHETLDDAGGERRRRSCRKAPNMPPRATTGSPRATPGQSQW